MRPVQDCCCALNSFFGASKHMTSPQSLAKMCHQYLKVPSFGDCDSNKGRGVWKSWKLCGRHMWLSPFAILAYCYSYHHSLLFSFSPILILRDLQIPLTRQVKWSINYSILPNPELDLFPNWGTPNRIWLSILDHPLCLIDFPQLQSWSSDFHRFQALSLFQITSSEMRQCFIDEAMFHKNLLLLTMLIVYYNLMMSVS